MLETKKPKHIEEKDRTKFEVGILLKENELNQ